MIFYGDWAPGRLRCDAALPGGCALVNLEGPILPADHALQAAPKAGPSLFSTALPRTDGRLLCSLANNHTMDYGAAGLALTREVLRARGALPVGAGATRDAAREPVFVTDAGVRVAIIACCEAQFGAAERERPGVAVLGPWVYDTIRTCRAQADAVVVSVHAGAELSPWPAPALQDLYRSWIDAGASVIHGHHPHVPQGFEEYNGGFILYGLGNLSVNPHDWEAYPNALWSLAVEVNFAARPVQWRVQTYALCDADEHVVIVSSDGADRRAYLHECNRALGDRGLLEALWQEVAVRTYQAYYRTWLRFPPKQKGVRNLFPLTPFRPPKASRQDLRLWYHLFACLTHSDLIATALGVLCGEFTDLRTAESGSLADRWLPWTVQDAKRERAPVEAPA